MQLRFRSSLSIGLGILIVISVAANCVSLNADPPPAQALTQPVPVEDDMHEFMEYLFQPTYKRLKTAMGTEPADKQAWKPIKSDALILAEGGNLLLSHGPESGTAEWQKLSIQVRSFGGELYHAAKARDYAKASRSYRSMIQSCNACHKDFADGKHILEP